MTPQAFEKLFKEMNERRGKLLNKKNVEYARGGDKLSNFKKAGAMDLTTPEHALWGMNKKHIISVTDMVNDLQNQGANYTMDQWREKLDDLRNYCDLLEALLVEREAHATQEP